MPSSRPQAAFEPVAPDLDLHQLVESTPNFEWATRIHCDMIDHHGLEQFERLILVQVVLGGKPLVIEGYETRLDKWTFAVQWLRDNCGQKVVDVRELNKDTNVPMTMEHYLKHMPALTNQWSSHNYKEDGRQRMYLKDMDCPPIWHDKLKAHIPLGLFYLNESTGDIDGFGAMSESDPSGSGVRAGRGIAKAGDLMSSLEKEMRAENLMCYIGHEGTYTPAHREMCGSLGHNIMVEASKNGVEDGKMTKAGSSIWFMTENKEREVVSEYWLSRLGHDIEVEKHFAQINAWRHAPFKTYVVEQKPGDFIIIPPLAPHQVWNRGTRTMKVAWNRTTVETLEWAFEEALFKARFVCRDEQYKNKAIVYYTLKKYSKLLRIADKHKRAGMRTNQSELKVKQLEKDFKRMLQLYTKVLVSESFRPDRLEKKAELVPFDGNITCSYCRCNIFNRFLTCPTCIGKLPDGGEDTYDICMECYAMGRSCACISKLKWVEQFDWKHLTQFHDQCRKQVIEIEQKVDAKSPTSLMRELHMLTGRRTLAQICQVELTRRPWHDINKSTGNENGDKDGEIEEEEVELDINGNVKKTKKKKVRRSEKYIREHGRCHIDCYWEPKWKQAHCKGCDKNYCYGNLFRAYDMMPQQIMEDPDWKCPSCQKICGCRQCRNKPGYKKHTPKGTLLGHNTKAVADPRSVESLVDFSHSNIAWIQKAGDDHQENTLRLLRRRKDADIAKAKGPQLGDDYVDESTANVEERLLRLAQHEGIPIDPALEGSTSTPESGDIEDEDAVAEHPELPRQAYENGLENSMEQDQWVPEGGVIWDSAHAYDNTDAITYVYPEPIPNPASQLPPPPTDGYVPIVPGYEEAAPQSPGNIEMVNRKRKRTKLDEGDQAYQFKKAKPKPKTKARKSLVVKLTVNKEKLAEIDRTANIARKALEAVTAPMIGSDLQALNVDHHAPSAPLPADKARPEELAEDDEHDDEFTPVRYRDRRKPPADGSVLKPPDHDVTRRTTRTHAVTYADPSDGEEEFDEVVPVPSTASKLATMERAVHDLDGSSDEELGSEQIDDQEQREENIQSSKSARQSSSHVTDSVSKPQTISKVSIHETISKPSLVRLGSPEDSGRPSTASSSSSADAASKVLAEAQANRKAKLAAIEGGADDSESIEEASSGQGTKESTPQIEAVKTHIPPKSSVGSKAPRLSLPSTNTTKAKPPAPRSVPRVSVVPRASAADWGESSSDDDIPYSQQTRVVKSAPGFVAINTNSPTMSVPSGAKRRGRPPKAR